MHGVGLVSAQEQDGPVWEISQEKGGKAPESIKLWICQGGRGEATQPEQVVGSGLAFPMTKRSEERGR